MIIEDNLESIFETLKKAAIALRDEDRISIDFSKLRPRGDIISSVQKPAQGAVAFYEIFNQALSGLIGGGTKEKNITVILKVNHPDILEFLSYKSNFTTKIEVNAEFMRAMENDQMYDLIDPRTGLTVNKLSARNVYNLISDKIAGSEESGIIYSQESLPFNGSATQPQAKEIIPPPIMAMVSQ
ncbi:hypothetical protein KJ951_02125 [Patescibacteria group bacterium]|nr:hypothetical protein [Patescibacteria group bacterium]MBU1703177.1 hypothetical protein [Patescibacteria group bacterium]MBU1953975.1 hypothetical protein [Patescibacteria group bacterium]